MADPLLEGSNIDVDTVQGVVTLSGTVPSEAGRARALAIAEALSLRETVLERADLIEVIRCGRPPRQGAIRAPRACGGDPKDPRASAACCRCSASVKASGRTLPSPSVICTR